MGDLERGLYFEEFNTGDKFFSGEREIKANDIKEFASLSGDFNSIHMDEGSAEKSIYGKRIAHGLLTLSVISGLAAALGFVEGTTIAFRSLEWKFKRPVYIGDKIKSSFKVIDKKKLPIDGAGLIIFRVLVTNQNGLKVQSGKWSLVIKNEN